jgi:hypothetical protein
LATPDEMVRVTELPCATFDPDDGFELMTTPLDTDVLVR